MKTEVYIYNLNGNRAAVRDYANTIASMSAKSCNAYVMAFDADDEITWIIDAVDDLDDVKASINWQGVRRVEIYDHSIDGSHQYESVYVTSQKSLDRYTSERSADDYDVKSNTTPYTADNWHTSDNSDTHNSNSDTPTDQTADTLDIAPVAPADSIQEAESIDTADTLDIAPVAPADSIQAAESIDTADTLDIAPVAPADSIQTAESIDTADTLDIAPVAHSYSIYIIGLSKN